ncbi:MAG: hypothetical protein ALAOOOJD_00270 [bacterium]|nr:hypothetical protein [bacterium]
MNPNRGIVGITGHGAGIDARLNGNLRRNALGLHIMPGKIHEQKQMEGQKGKKRSNG